MSDRRRRGLRGIAGVRRLGKSPPSLPGGQTTVARAFKPWRGSATISSPGGRTIAAETETVCQWTSRSNSLQMEVGHRVVLVRPTGRRHHGTRQPGFENPGNERAPSGRKTGPLLRETYACALCPGRHCSSQERWHRWGNATRCDALAPTYTCGSAGCPMSEDSGGAAA